jgi:hypothetical protein
MTTISTSAYSTADFLTLLSQAGIDSTDATYIANHLRSPVVVETVPPGAIDRTINQLIPNVTLNGGTALADQPQVLLVDEGDLRVDTSNFARLQYIVLEDSENFNALSVSGTANVHVYFGDLSGAPTVDSFGVSLSGSGNDTVVGGNANHDEVGGGAGKLQVTLGDGNNDQVAGGTGAEQHFVLGNGRADYVLLGSGAYQTAVVGTGNGDLLLGGSGDHQSLTSNGIDARQIAGTGNYQTLSGGTGSDVGITGGPGSHDVLIGSTGGNDDLIMGTGNNQTAIAMGANDLLIGGSGVGDALKSAFANTTFNDGSGANMKLIGTGGHATFNVGSSPNESVVSLGGYNIINVSGGAGNTVTIQGTATDTLNISQDYSAATITVAKGVATLQFADGETIKVTGIDQATFNGTGTR